MQFKLSKVACSLISAGALSMVANAYAAEETEDTEVIQVQGIRASLTSALNQKRDANNLIEVIQSEDIGKLPDQNLAEVLENVTGIQITRTAGVGTGVQIRGSNANIVQVNGMQTVGTGDGRTGMKFEDLAAGIIAGVEVIKAPTAQQIEGSIGGTVNLKTIRPLALSDTLATVRVQGEDSSLTTDGIMPRISGAFGDNWENSSGRFGFVVSGAFSKQEATSFRPRVDRDGGLVENKNAQVANEWDDDDNAIGWEDASTVRPVAQDFDFVGIQFLNQETENFEYNTKNLASSFEYAPNDDMRFFFDAVVTDQEVRQESTRVQGSGVSSVLNQNLPEQFETVNFGSLGGQDLGSIQVATKGTIQPFLSKDDDDPNLRFNSDTGARVTKTKLFRLGGQWQVTDNLKVKAELSSASSDTETPKLDTQLNFINPNPNTPLDGLDDNGEITSSTSNDNAVPFAYDLRGGALTFGIDFASPYAPTVAQLLDPNNVVLDQVDFSHGKTENSDTAFRVDATYYFDDGIISSIDAGFRINQASHESLSVSDRVGGFSKMIDSPSGSLFKDILVEGPDNFGDADGRELALRNYVIVDPELAFSNPTKVMDTLYGALETHRANMESKGFTFSNEIDYLNTDPQSTAGFKVEEDTTAVYAQANFSYEMLRGNFGVRYIESEVNSIGNTEINGEVKQITYSDDYNYTLPRLNLIAEVTDDLIVRAAWGKDITRPEFGNMNTSVTFGTNENASVEIGNPGLLPMEVTSYDISAEWYFAEAAVLSVGYFEKDMSNLFVTGTESAATFPRPDGGKWRETDPNCPGGGVYNPAVQPGILGDPSKEGMCVDIETSLNDPATVTQSGIEMAFQYDLSQFEGELGWASGFGIQANYTIQEYKGGSVENESATRGTDIFNAIQGVYDQRQFTKVKAVQGLLDFSENAYNITAYYEKHGLSARVRYTWREAFRTDDTAAGASRNSTLGFPVYTHDRGQVNASVSYDVNDNLNLGIEAVNLTKSEIQQSCVNEGALLCFQGLADRRITAGVTYKF
ncbi:TonB-dependent receptor [Catenovulum agarivorans DS-2]|uniref:TonB-dependent receptor n=1 Tax=Catenovulum agarivorans DS-2 TaxID=1328313 RepID=W7QCI9_9ALTE|nr:TonB-dependent receptor [Catenovulum agarivorans]EWH09616.1 TonB-dependent receptor [Catenovulum agarivorans DS-2]